MQLTITFFLLFLQCHLRFGKIHFPLADVFYLEGQLRLESSSIWVNTVYSGSAHDSHMWQDVFPILFL